MKNFKLKTKTKDWVITKSGRLNKRYSHALQVAGIDHPKNCKLYPVHTSGSGRFTTNIDLSHNITNILKAQGYRWSTGNDAPRGGKTGNYIKVSKRALEFLTWLYDNYS